MQERKKKAWYITLTSKIARTEIYCVSLRTHNLKVFNAYVYLCGQQEPDVLL